MICKRVSTDGAYEKLIESGIKLFGTYGYDAVSTRQITKHAEVNIAAVCYHFGGKKKFYEEVVNHLTHEVIDFINKFDASKLEKMDAAEAKLTVARLIRDYQSSFISEHGINRLNIFMHEAFLQGSVDAKAMYTNIMKATHTFFTRVFTIYFTKTGKDLELVNFSIALIHGLIQSYVITNKNIAPSQIKLNYNVLEQSIKTILE